MLLLFQKLDDADQAVVHTVIQNNSYFCHPKNILLSAVGNVDENNRKFACGKIIPTRRGESHDRI